MRARAHVFSWLLVGWVLGAGCGGNDEIVSPVLVCELRVPKPVNPDAKTTRVSLASATGETGHFLWGYNQKDQKEESGFLIFQPDEFVLDEEPDARRALIVGEGPGPSQVFYLPLPRNPKARDWSQWRRPDCLAAGDVGWSVIHNQRANGVSTNVPPDCFELRYKVELRDLGPSYEALMKRKSGAQ
ncbi:MAG TPA: hypothetical protein VMV72_19440 [Verrucomicrobiae bacterium]|nr:hypothetical protein [Verrucomicrobiae bacterium]